MSGRASEIFRRVETGCAVLLFTAVVVLVAGASVARAAGSPIIWSIEIAQLCFIWLCVLAIDLAMQEQRHFSLSVMSDALGPRGRKALELANRVVLIGLLCFLMIYAWRNTALMHSRMDGAVQLRSSWTHGSMVLGIALLIRTLLVQTLAVWRTPADAAGTA